MAHRSRSAGGAAAAAAMGPTTPAAGDNTIRLSPPPSSSSSSSRASSIESADSAEIKRLLARMNIRGLRDEDVAAISSPDTGESDLDIGEFDEEMHPGATTPADSSSTSDYTLSFVVDRTPMKTPKATPAASRARVLEREHQQQVDALQAQLAKAENTVHMMTHKHALEIRALQSYATEAANARTALADATERNDRRIQLLKDQLTAEQEANLGLRKALAETRAQIDKALRFDEVERALNEHKAMVESQGVALTGLRDQLSTANRTIADLEKRVELLKADKAYLQQEASKSNRLIADAEERAARQIEEARRTSSETFERDKLDMRIARDEAAAEAARLRHRLEELQQSFERERNDVRLSRDEAMTETNRLRHRLDGLQKAYDELSRSQRVASADADAALSEVRSKLKIKSFEHEALQVAHEELTALLKKVRMEADMEHEKNAVLQAEFNKLETTSAKEAARLHAELEKEKHKVEAYEQLELDLDQAVLIAGHGEPHMETMALSMPTNSQRRVRQSITLARRLVVLNEELSAAKAQVIEARQALTVAQEEAAAAKRDSENAKQPHQFLVETISEHRQKVRDLKAKLAAVQAELQAANGELGTKSTENAQLKSELHAQTMLLQELQQQVQQAMQLQQALQAQRTHTSRSGGVSGPTEHVLWHSRSSSVLQQ